MARKKNQVEETEMNEETESEEPVSNEEASEILQSVSLNDTPVELSEDSEESKDLYAEFSSFIKKKADMSEDTGVTGVIPTGIDILDAILGGGFAIGKLSIIVGQPGSGKSMLAMQTLGNAQKIHDGKLLGAMLDSEESTTTVRLSNLGVRYPKIKPYSDITIENVFKFLEGLCVFKQEKGIVDVPSMVLWDSIANTLSQVEIEATDPNSVIGRKAKILSLLVPKYVAKCSRNNICLLAVNQLRDDLAIGPYGPPKELKFLSGQKTMPGGTVVRYNAFQLVEMKVGKAIVGKDVEKYGLEGISVKVKCVKNKLFSPNVDIELIGSFTHGFSNFWTNYNFLVDTKRLSSGAWNYLVSFPEQKFRTKDAINLYRTEPKFKAAFDENVKEAIQTEIVDKHNIEL